MKIRRSKKRVVLLLASYCDSPTCTDELPCEECLKMCNVAEIKSKINYVYGGYDFLRYRHNMKLPPKKKIETTCKTKNITYVSDATIGREVILHP